MIATLSFVGENFSHTRYEALARSTASVLLDHPNLKWKIVGAMSTKPQANLSEVTRVLPVDNHAASAADLFPSDSTSWGRRQYNAAMQNISGGSVGIAHAFATLGPWPGQRMSVPVPVPVETKQKVVMPKEASWYDQVANVINTPEYLKSEAVCTICSNLIRNPCGIESDSCKHIFCQHCLQTWMLQKETCPVCRKESRQGMIVANRAMASLFREIEVHCPQCDWKGTRSLAVEHKKCQKSATAEA